MLRLPQLRNFKTDYLNHIGLSYKIASSASFSSSAKEEISIPKRIHRSPTDILRALESTVRKDGSNPHYKFHDDPFLLPASNAGKRAFALAQESGRKAAHWIREQHSELFQHKEADPPIELFSPKKIYFESKDLKEKDLRQAIDKVCLIDAISIYKKLSEKKAVSDELQQDFLEFLCYFNSEEPLGEDFIEERWFRQSEKGRNRHRKTWKDGGLAEEIFIGIEKPNGKHYSALIQGMAKYFQVERALQLFNEAQEKQLDLNLEAYNSMIRVSNFIMEGYEKRWEFVVDILNRIRLAKLKPDLNTLNSVLECLSVMGTRKLTKQYVLQTLAEFKNLGIEPSLGSWFFVLEAFCKDRGPISTILHDIMNEIENKEFTIRHIRDTHFFVTAMEVARHHLHDKNLAKRVHDLLMFGNNYDLIGDSYKESVYYRHLCILICETEPLEEFIEHTYNKYVPNIYIPEPGVMEEILNTVLLNSASKYLPKLWSDVKIFEMSNREKLLNVIVEIMIKDESPDENSIKKFAEIAWEIFLVPKEREGSLTNQVVFSAEFLSDLLTLLLRNNDFEKASEVMSKLESDRHNVMGVPKIDSMKSYIEECIKEKSPSKAIMCIQYCSDCGFQDVQEMAQKLNDSLTLDENHIGKLQRIVGDFSTDKK